MKFCPDCGASTLKKIPTGDNRRRDVCSQCETIHYQNPKMVVGTLTTWQEKVLLCRRAIEPAYGLWTLPAGFMELGETTLEGALRETQEEACAKADIDDLYSVVNIPHIGHTQFFYRAQLIVGDTLEKSFSAGEESLEVALFDEAEIPWETLAFRSVRETLRCFFADRKAGNFGLHHIDLQR